MSAYAAYLHDAVLLYAMGLQEVVKSGQDVQNSQHLLQKLKDKHKIRFYGNPFHGPLCCDAWHLWQSCLSYLHRRPKHVRTDDELIKPRLTDKYQANESGSERRDVDGLFFVHTGATGLVHFDTAGERNMDYSVYDLQTTDSLSKFVPVLHFDSQSKTIR